MKDRAIIVSAFGTSTAAKDTYSFFEDKLRGRYPQDEIFWAFSSRKLRNKMTSFDPSWNGLAEVLKEVAGKGYSSAVIQSLHIVPGVEFEKILHAAEGSKLNLSIGMPLLSSDIDCCRALDAVSDRIADTQRCITLLVGHGTSQSAAGACYLQFNEYLQKRYPDNVFLAMVEGQPTWSAVVKALKKSRIRKIKFIPFMFVAGEHILYDVLGAHEESWAFQLKGYEIDHTEKGLGFNEKIIAIYFDHLKDALLKI